MVWVLVDSNLYSIASLQIRYKMDEGLVDGGDWYLVETI